MKKTGFWVALLWTIPFLANAQAPDAILGEWLNEEKDARVEIYKSSGKYSGKITWIKNAFEADGKTPQRDSKNSDPSLRNRPLKDMIILSDFTFKDGLWTGGKVYDPKSGKSYSSKMTLDGSTLEIRGYVGSPLFGRTTVWTRPK
ncbi:MAG: DUF2147 domain-containing protein [Dyadobacter sp.]|uniref:DUF2147 domain-containing protein n=1 Tax=Dyadobacter sp. TaxID=1914288 RepID=UPI001B2A470E|nr:DUF2147 domain-containing protein [Dyadobacter sp.]MBO9611256.1 DUF2147 domain-containing protein [Dyadobacter sp.]